MPVIKRYPNRKLYDTQAKQYITLEGVAELIRRGEDVHVVDNASGEDMTALTLTQIIVEQEKKQSGLMSRSVLANIIKTSGEGLSALQRSLASPLGIWHQIDEEIKRRVQALIKQGELTEKEGQGLLEKLLAQKFRPPEAKLPTQDDIERVLVERQVPNRSDLQSLMEKLEALSASLDDVNKSG